jgi:hypothetical protein
MDCWCKYDMNPGQNTLADFVSLRSAGEPAHGTPQHYKLVIHSSVGSTGIYSQYEAQLRIYGKKLRKSIQFLSRKESSGPTGPWPSTVSLKRRWFATAPIAERVWGGILVEAKGTFAANRVPCLPLGQQVISLRAFE